jgi:hypothetical protein
VNFFFDRCVAVHLARMLDAYDRDNTIAHLDGDNRFSPTTPDIDWIQTIAADQPKPVLITADQRMRRDPVERHALAHSGLTIVFLRAGFHKLTFHDQAVKLLTMWPKIVELVGRVAEPTAFEITPAARKVDRLCKTKDL